MGIEIPPSMRRHQGQLVHGDFYWIDVLLKDRRVFKGATTDGDRILGSFSSSDGGKWLADYQFTTEDIRRIRPHSPFPFWESIVYFFAPPYDPKQKV